MRIYARVLSTPGAIWPWVFSLTWRLHAGMSSLAIILYVQSGAGTIAQAGACDGAMAAGVAATAIIKTRLIDRYGVARVLVPQSAVIVVGYTTLTVGHSSNSFPVMLAGACLVGMGWAHIGANMRLLWLRVHERRKRLRAASAALESSLGPAAQTVSPLLVALLVLVFHPFGALAVCCACGIVAPIGFSSAPLARQHGYRGRNQLRGIGWVGFPVATLLAISALQDLALGALPVIVVFAAKHSHHPAVAGVILAVLAVTEAAAALKIGTGWLQRHWRPAIPASAVATAACCTVILLAPGDLLLVGIVLAVFGLVQGPYNAGVLHGVGEIVAPSRVNEALSYNQTLISIGGAAGAAAGGTPIGSSGLTTAWMCVGAVMIIAALVGAAFVRLSAAKIAPASCSVSQRR